MEYNEDLARLEQFVEKLIDNHNQLKSENKDIYAQLQAKQQEIVELQEMIENLQKDRNVIHNRVTGLIDRIDEWEKAFDREDAGQNNAAGKEAAQNPAKSSSPLFKAKSEQSSESAVR